MASAAEQPKKPAGGAFGRFMAEKRSEFMKQCAGQPVSAVTKLGGEKWRGLSEEEKVPYQKAFEEAQKKYASDMEAFLAAGGVKQKGAAALRSERKKAKEGKVEKDPNRPKRPAGGAYGCFVAAHRAEFQKECPGSVTGVSKLAGEKWKALPEADKDKYNTEYKAKLAAYEEAKKTYVPPAAAEDDEADEDDEAQEPSPKKAKVTKAEKTSPEKQKQAAGPGKGRGKGKKAKPVAEEEQVDIPESVLAKADNAQMTDNLKKLLSRGDVKNANISASKAFAALEESGGLLHPARRALLGA